MRQATPLDPAPGGQSVRVVKEPGGRLCHFENGPALAKSSRAEPVGTMEGQFRKMVKVVIKMATLILDSRVLAASFPAVAHGAVDPGRVRRNWPEQWGKSHPHLRTSRAHGAF